MHKHQKADLQALLSQSANIITDTDNLSAYLEEPRGRWPGTAVAVAVPKTVDELAGVLREAYARHFMIVPQGGNTGLVGGQTLNAEKVLVLNCKGLRERAEVDSLNNTLTLSAGYTLHEAQVLAHQHDKLLPLRLASEGSCTIGGNMATNAGGTQVLSYGNSRDLALDIEAVLPSGELIRGLRHLRKDNTGYDLRHLIIGSEGTLAIITAVVLKLFSRPKYRLTLMLGVQALSDIMACFISLRDHFGILLTAAELMPRAGLDLVIKHGEGVRRPMRESHEWYALFEFSAPCALSDDVQSFLSHHLDENRHGDIIVAQSDAQADALWSLRHNLSRAQRLEGPSIKHDISVPLSAIVPFIAEAVNQLAICSKYLKPVFFGHMGDGNLHANVSMAEGGCRETFEALRPEVEQLIHGLVLSYGGSVAAEHGLGRAKSGLLASARTQAEIDIYKQIKNLFDPKGLMNPGVIIRHPEISRR